VEADQLLQAARTEADTFAKDREEKQAEVEAEMAEMSTLVASVRNRLAVLATTVADKLDEMDAAVAETRMDAGDAAADDIEEVADITIDAAGDDEVELEVVDDMRDDVDDIDEPEPGTELEEEAGSAGIESLDVDDRAGGEEDLVGRNSVGEGSVEDDSSDEHPGDADSENNGET
jgi:hypothetical protein